MEGDNKKEDNEICLDPSKTSIGSPSSEVSNEDTQMSAGDSGDAKDMSVDESCSEDIIEAKKEDEIQVDQPKHEADNQPKENEASLSETSNVSQDSAVIKEPEVSVTAPKDVTALNSTTLTKEQDSIDNLPGSSTESQTREDTNSVYHLKWFDWKGQQTPIITQNENGPCPLLGIANVLILARKIELPPMQQIISGTQLMEYIGDCILSSAPEQDRDNEELILNYQQNMQDAIDIMYKLQTGIDVNVKFSGVCDFEFTRECIVFDLLKIALYHGWLVDPQDAPAENAIGNLSYNQVVEKLLTSKDSPNDDIVSAGLAIEDFLGRTASQLTYHGLCELNDTVQEEELCVFFRNNHFSTLYKHKGELFLLVTDQGFLTEPAVIWETLVNIEGDGQFVNSEFRTIQLQSNSIPPVLPPKETTSNNTAATSVTPEMNLSQEDQDYLLALSLQQERNSPIVEPKHSPPSDQPVTQQERMDSDHALAMQLQEDEDRQAALQQQQQRQQQNPQQQGSSPNRQQTQGSSPPPQVNNSQGNNQPDRGSSPEKCYIL